MPRCFALFSGGLDSALAIKIMQQQGIDVIALNFVSHFFGGPSEKGTFMAKQLNVPIMYVPFEEQQLAVTLNPTHGRGKNFNACIDCHAAMIRVAGKLMSQYNVDFIVTGEVLGQRPMSQNAAALKKVQALSEFGELILRPLSGKILPEVEANKFVPRDKLQDIEGRSTHRQEKMAKEFGIVTYPSHGGGCLLTDPTFALKMKKLSDDGSIFKQNQFMMKAMNSGRVIRIDASQYIIVGRDYKENCNLEKYFEFCTHITAITPVTDEQLELPGPHMLILDFTNQKGEPVIFNEVQIKPTDLEDVQQPGECKMCPSLEEFHNEKVFFKAGDDLVHMALKTFNYFCKGKGKVPAICELDGVKVKTEAVEETDVAKIRAGIIGI
ncbi:TRNA_(5-methylaminomethyl-2-thiouridylate)-methyltransferase [Hexamita inflata]|uniref:tRNA_(5-methylaminomethyl-2-thiouridylate)-methyl transferase n=1 Tax=Hexamita inflata TaxID=28002 RepID=A0ABP1HFZ5_9EUKA